MAGCEGIFSTPPSGARRFRPAWLVLAGLALSPAAFADPEDDARRHYRAGMDAAKVQDYDTALQEFLVAQSLYSKPQTLFNIGLAYARKGQPADAVAYFEQAIALLDDLPGRSLLYVGAAYASAGQLERAQATYQEALARDPSVKEQVEPILAALAARLEAAAAPPPAEVAAPVASAPAAAATAAFQESSMEAREQQAAELAQISEDLAQRSLQAEPDPMEGTVGPPVEAPPPEEAAPEVQAPDDDAFFVEAYQRVVVTASRYGQDPLDSPSTVSILTAEDIRLSGASNIPDLLRRVAGVDVMSLSAGQSDVSIRGFNREMSNKVLVLVDGRSVYLDILAAPIWSTLSIGLHEIERIEIIRGPGSAVYGANAMTGVINIITRTPGTGENVVSGEGGSPGYGQGTALVTGRSGATAYRLSGGFHQTGRWTKDADIGDDSALNVTFGETDLALQTVRADGRLDRTFGDKGFASLSAGYVEGLSEFFVFGALGDYGQDFTNSYVRGDIAWGPVHLRSFWNALRAQAGPWLQYDGGRDLLTRSDSDVFDLELETNGSFETGRLAHRFNLGVGYRYKQVEWGYLEGGGTPISENHFNAFGQDQVSIGPVNVVGSLRVDKHPLVAIQHTISPRGAVVARVAERTTLRVTGGTSFRAPSLMESYLDLNQLTDADGVFVRTLGDRQLLPERTVTGELGLHDESTRYHRADLVGYVNRVSDLIYVQDVEPLPQVFDPDNNGFAAGATRFGNLTPVYTGVGAELDTTFFPADGLDLYANLNVQRIFEDDGQDVVPDGSTSLVKGNVGVAYRTPWRVDVAVHNHFMSAQTWRLRSFDDAGQLTVTEQPLPARNIAVARITARPTPDESLELGLTAWNLGHLLGGDAFREHPEGQLVSSRLYGTLTYRF